MMTLAPPAVQAEEPIRIQLSQADMGSDPLRGLDLEQLKAEKQRLMSLKASPETAALLSVLPGAGHFYAGQNVRGAWVLGGFAGTLLLSFLGSYLLSSINNDIGRTAAVMVNVVPTSAYWAWSVSDAYYQTSLRNVDIDNQIHDISLKQREYGDYSSLLQIHF
ncbi:MAG: hypothetical protein ACAI44_10825 [Candidatus Sericytochromatia bacterium]